MQLWIYNSLTQAKQHFKPLNFPHVKLYVCGLTVYDDCHLGHARMLVCFDMIVRILRYLGYEVNYIRNITDIDDKIIARANANGETIDQLTSRMIASMQQDFTQLNLLPPNQEPRATLYINHMIDLIQKLINKNYAYAASNGDVYYNIHEFKSYGSLSHRSLEDMKAGSRIDISESKKDPLDFVLWKAAKAGEPAWDSPWGKGRPGWHTECAVMSLDCLGESIDIHGGGMDLLFPHHENEIAQVEAVTHQKFVQTWMHVGYLQIDSEKMSKSLGNFFTLKNILEKYDAETIRYFLLSSHYRSPLNYTEENLKQAETALKRLQQAAEIAKNSDLSESSDLSVEAAFMPPEPPTRPLWQCSKLPQPPHSDLSVHSERFMQALCDDFNTPQAFSILFEIAREINRLKSSDPHSAKTLALELKTLANILGVSLSARPTSAADNDLVTRIEKLILERELARKEKNWAAADRLRNELLSLQVVLKDTPQGTTWRKI